LGTRHLLNANQGPVRASIISSLALPIQLAETKRAAFSLDSILGTDYRPRDGEMTGWIGDVVFVAARAGLALLSQQRPR
jgi:hypothetical protein